MILNNNNKTLSDLSNMTTVNMNRFIIDYYDDLVDICAESGNEPISLDILSYLINGRSQMFELAYNRSQMFELAYDRYRNIGRRSLLSSIAVHSYYDFKFTAVDSKVSVENAYMSLRKKYRNYGFLKKY